MFRYCIQWEKSILYAMLKKWCWILIAALLAVPLAGENNPSETNPGKSKSIPISLIIPGIEQIKNKQYFKGSLFLAAFMGSAAAAFYFNKKGNDWFDKYQASTNVEQIILYRKNTETNLKRRNLFLVSLFSVWLLHVLDLKFFKPGKTGVKSSLGKNEIDIGFYYNF